MTPISKIGDGGDRFGAYLCENCANLPSALVDSINLQT